MRSKISLRDTENPSSLRLRTAIENTLKEVHANKSLPHHLKIPPYGNSSTFRSDDVEIMYTEVSIGNTSGGQIDLYGKKPDVSKIESNLREKLIDYVHE